MIIGIGVDIIEVERIKESYNQYGYRFLNRIFTEEEIAYCMEFKGNEFVHLAARFAVKEAFSKAIGTGITQGFKLKDVSIKNKASGEPELILNGYLLEIYGKYKNHVTISHTTTNSVAVVIIEE
jgi:holo-[acyl-carrier protein] synthase